MKILILIHFILLHQNLFSIDMNRYGEANNQWDSQIDLNTISFPILNDVLDNCSSLDNPYRALMETQKGFLVGSILNYGKCSSADVVIETPGLQNTSVLTALNHGDSSISDAHEDFTDKGIRHYQSMINVNVAIENSITQINSVYGNLYHKRRDLMIPGLGIPLIIEFTYNSGSFFDGRYGYGWQMNYNIRYITNDSNKNVMIVRHDDRRDIFLYDSTKSFVPTLGIKDSLIALPDGYKLIVWNSEDYYNNDYMVYYFDSPEHHYLTRIEDRNGNNLQLEYDNDRNLIRIIDASARVINFIYTNMLLTKIIDFSGREINYKYDSERNMIEYVSPDGNSTKYDYSSECHDLISIINANNDKYQFTYNDDFCVASVDHPGLANAYQIKYNFTDGINEVFDGNGNKTVYYFDSKDRVNRIKDAFGISTSFEWDDNFLLKSIIDKKNNSIDFNYDFRGNIINIHGPGTSEKKFEYHSTFNKPKKITNANNFSTNYDYDSKGNLIKITDAMNNVNHYEYNNLGLLINHTDPNNSQSSYQYDNNGNLIKETDNENNVLQYSYDTLGNLLSHTDAKGYTNYYQYDRMNRLKGIINPLKQNINYEYDNIGNLIKHTDPKGKFDSFIYNKRNLLFQHINKNGDSLVYNYDNSGNRISSKNENGNISFFQYDSLNRIEKLTDALNYEKKFTYDNLNNLTSTTDAMGNTTNFRYDENNLLIAIIDALNQTKTMSYDLVGNMLSETDANGNNNSYQYNALNQLILSKCPTGCMTKYEYDGNGNLISIEDPLMRKSYFEYNKLGQLVKTINPDGNLLTRTYDANGNLNSETDENGNETIITYDSLNRINVVISPLGYKNEFKYDESGNILSFTDENQYVTHYEYDARDRIIKITEPLNSQLLFEYDAVGNRIKETDQMGNQTLYEYDKLNRNTKITSPLKHLLAFKYDAVSNIIEKTDPNGSTVKYSFDKLNRLILTLYPNSTQVSYEYDPVDNLIKMTNSDGLKEIITRVYDQKNRISTESIDFGEFTKSVSYTYDAADNLLSITDPDGKTITYEYNSIDRLTQITDQNGKVITSTYHPTGKVKSILYPDSLLTNFEIDKDNRTTKIKTVDIYNNPVFEYQYNLDPTGRILSTQKNGINESFYQFDCNNRLIMANYLNSSNKYTYNLAGQRISKDENNGVTTYSYNDESRISLQTFPDGKSIKYNYDNNGNVIKTSSQWGIVYYEYDFLNRLSKINYPNQYGTIQFYYSPENILLARKKNDTVTYYFPSLMGTISEFDSEGNTITTFNPGISFDKNENTTLLLNNKKTYYQHWDLNKSTVFFSGSSVTATFSNDYFGSILEYYGEPSTVDPGLFSNGMNVDWDAALGAELIGIAYSPDIDQNLNSGRIEFGHKIPAIPWGWCDGGGVDDKEWKEEQAAQQRLRDEINRLRDELRKLKELLQELLKKSEKKIGPCKCKCKPKIKRESVKFEWHSSIRAIGAPSPGYNVTGEVNGEYSCLGENCDISSKSIKWSAKIYPKKSKKNTPPTRIPGASGPVTPGNPSTGNVFIPYENLFRIDVPTFSSIDVNVHVFIICNDGTKCDNSDTENFTLQQIKDMFK